MLDKGKIFTEQTKGGRRKFFKPFVLYGTIGQAILTICMLVENETHIKLYIYSPIRSLVLGGTWPGNTPLWFIPSLFVSQCMFAWLADRKINGYCIALIGFGVAFLLYLINWKFIPVYIGSGLFGIFFYAMGKMMHEHQGNHYFFGVALIGLLGLYVWRGLPPVGIRHIAQCGGSILDVFQWTLMALYGCFVVNYIFRYVQPLLKFPTLQYLGRNAMTFYVSHWIVMLIVIRLIMGDLLNIWNPYVLLAAGFVSCAVLIPLCILVKNRISND